MEVRFSSWAKKSDFTKLSNTDVQNIEDKLNNRPRKRYKFQTPIFVMNQLLFNWKVAFIGCIQLLVCSEYKDKPLQTGDGGTSREAITKLQLEEFKIPLPSISKQQIIVPEIEKIEAKITDLEKQIAQIPN